MSAVLVTDDQVEKFAAILGVDPETILSIEVKFVEPENEFVARVLAEDCQEGSAA